MYMGDIKLFSKNEKELETLIQTVRLYIQDIGIEFGIVKCAMLVMKSRKWHMTEGIELPNQEKIRALGEKETNKYLVSWHHQKGENENEIRKEYHRRTRKLLEKKLYSRNIKGINTWAVPS